MTKGSCLWVAPTSKIRVWIRTQGWQDRCGVCKEGYAAFCAGCLSDHHVVLCKVRLGGTWIRKREVMDGPTSIRSEKFKEGYAMSPKRKRVEKDEENNYVGPGETLNK